MVVDCRLVGHRTLPGQDTPQATTHFTGRVRMRTEPPTEERVEPPALDPGGAASAGPEAIYGVYFHGPAYQVLAEAWKGSAGPVGRLATGLPPNHEPADASLVTHPRLLELCFQTAGTWELGRSGRMALPTHLDRVELVGAPTDGAELVAVVRTHQVDGDDTAAFDADVVDATGVVVLRMRGYRTIELPAGPGDELLEPLRAAMA
jgi:hypothetical protein